MSITGTWKITLQTPMGVKKGSITFSEEEGSFKGLMTGPTGEVQELKDLVLG